MISVVLLQTGASDSPAVTEVVNAGVVTLGGNVSTSVTVTPDKRRTATLEHVILQNQSTSPIEGPVYLIVKGLPPRVKLLHARGVSRVEAPGDPFIEVSAGQLAAGQRLPFTLHFANPQARKLHLSFEVFAGTGAV
jgi:hypothetical protein